MLFQGRELHVGDKLVSRQYGEITVCELDVCGDAFNASIAPDETCWWDRKGRYVSEEDRGIDATWPDSAPKPAPDREDEYRRIWLEEARENWRRILSEGFPMTDTPRMVAIAFDLTDAFIAELRRRDGEGK